MKDETINQLFDEFIKYIHQSNITMVLLGDVVTITDDKGNKLTKNQLRQKVLTRERREKIEKILNNE